MWIAVLVEDTDIDMRVFRGRAVVICDMINRQLALRKFKIPGIKKITITLTAMKDVDYITGPLKGYSPVANIRRTFDFGAFNTSSDERKNDLILNLIEDSIKRAAEHLSWNIKNFDHIANEVRRLGFKHRYLEWKLKRSESGKNKAGVEVEMLAEEARIYIVFYSASGQAIKQVKLIAVRPDRLFILPLMGKAFWLNHDEFELVDKRKEVHFNASLLKEDAQIYFTPMKRDVNEVIDDLLILAASTTDSVALSLLQEKIRK